ncbi:MAG: HDOD domain-containing protein [Betaproteobacteria bacterium]|nr:HDOD domain-containing protein [Betaproteobacteria bacterium]
MQIESLAIHKRLTTARLPALPQVLLELMALCDRDDVGMAEIGAVVGKDAGIAARVVAIANSPYYRPGRGIETIDQCLAVLGTSTMRRLALNQSVAELFGRFQKSRDYDLGYFWFHGLSVAVTARKLAEKFHYGNADEAYLAGLLHDVGQLALLTTEGDHYLDLFRDFTGEQELMRREQAAFGLTHAEVGAWLAERWGLHAIFVDSLLYHHETVERVKQAHPLVQIVMLANLFNAQADHGVAAQETDLAFWNLDTPQVLELLEVAQTEARAIAAELGIELPLRPAPLAATSIEEATPTLAEAVAQRMEGMLGQPEMATAPEIDAALLDIRRGASMLFGARACAVFTPENAGLRWRDGQDHDPRGAEIAIDPADPRCRIALAFHGRIGLVGHKAVSEHLADMQVLRLLGGERLLCLPLAFEGDALGVLAVGIDVASLEYFARKQALLLTFSREAGRRLGLAVRMREQTDGALRGAAEAQQLQTRKLVHEANNPLGVIRNYLAVLRQQLANPEQAGKDIDLVEEELRRVGRILRGMREPAGASVANVEAKVNLNTLIGDAVRFWRMGKPELRGIDIAYTATSDLPPIATDADKLKQVLSNLVFNAAEAMGGRGRIELGATLWRAGRDGHTLEISVRDHGPGLSAEMLENLERPKSSGKGGEHAGLGLAIVSSLVGELGGSLQCATGSTGTHFKISLPIGT